MEIEQGACAGEYVVPAPLLVTTMAGVKLGTGHRGVLGSWCCVWSVAAASMGTSATCATPLGPCSDRAEIKTSNGAHNMQQARFA